MKKIVIGVLVVSAFAFANQDIKETAKKSMMMLGSTLKGELKAKFKEDPSGMAAIDYCSDKAQDITTEVNGKLDEGVNIRRTALKYRNDLNEPTMQDIEVMSKFQNDIEVGKKSAKTMMKIVEDTKKTYVYKALAVGKPCLKCHGDVAKMDKNILGKIDERFPYDRARNFALGDFRGAIVVEINK
jgi:hypothetical protein